MKLEISIAWEAHGIVPCVASYQPVQGDLADAIRCAFVRTPEQESIALLPWLRVQAVSGTVIFDLTGICILAAAYHEGRVGSQAEGRYASDGDRALPLAPFPGGALQTA